MACPDESLVRAYAMGALSPEDTWVKGHVAGCPSCTGKLMRVGSTQDQTKAVPAPAPVGRPLPRLEHLVPKHDAFSKGASIGRYIVQGELGEGGMGKVYACLDPELDRRVALKLLHAGKEGSSAGSGGEARLLREAQAMARLSHPNVVAVHDVGRHEGHVFVAMEMIDGTNLKQWLVEARQWRQVLDVFIEAGKGLAAAHAKGLLHRDFKPPNVLIGADGRVRVGDFGIARAVETQADPVPEDQDAPTQEHDRLAQPLTKTGSVVGTFGYVSPEAMIGQTVDARADVFSYSVSLYEALYGARPYRGRTYGDYYAALALGPPSAPPKSSPAPAWLFKAVRKGMATKLEERFASMSEMLAALEPPRGLLGSLFKR